MRARRRYISTAPATAADPNFGPAFSTPDPFALTTKLYVSFGMRVTSFANSTAHQWGQWGAIGSFNQSWGHSFHVGGFPRLAVYPTGDNPSLIGIQSARSFADVLGDAVVAPVWLWVAALVDLDVDGAGTTRRFAYWCGLRPRGLTLMDDQTEAGAATFFNSSATLTAAGYVGSACDRYVDLEVRETPTGPLLIDPRIQRQGAYLAGSFGGGPDTWVGPDGRTYTLGAFGEMVRSPKPRPYAAAA